MYESYITSNHQVYFEPFSALYNYAYVQREENWEVHHDHEMADIERVVLLNTAKLMA